MNGHPNQGVESQPQPTLCSNGCGFFANVGTHGMCSKCFRETEGTKQNATSVAQAVQAATASSSQPAAVEAAAAPAAAAEALPASSPEASSTPAAPSSGAGSPAPPPTNKCNVECCRKKLGLTGFKCRCGLTFCGQHRHAEGHNCTFDWKAMGRLKIADNNPLVQAAKIQKI